MDEKMRSAIESFIQQRLTDCAMRDNETLQNAYQHYENCLNALKTSLIPEQTAVFIALENVVSVMDGETQNCYYRAGFTDAVVFLWSWRGGAWN